MNYCQPTRIINQSLCIWLIALATFVVSSCSSRSIDVSTNNINSGWDGVQHAELKKQFKAFVGGWEGMSYDNFLDTIAQAVTKQAARRTSKKNDGKVVYYIPMKYLLSTEEKITEGKKKGPFYSVVFQGAYSRVSGKLKNIYDCFLLPDEPTRSKDANLFIVACFLKFTEEVDKTLKQINIDNDALLQQLTQLLQDFQSKIAEVYSKSDLYKNKNKYTEAMGMVIKPFDENNKPKLTFEKNQQATYAMNARCMLTKPLAAFLYEQCKGIKTEMGKLEGALKEAAQKASEMEEPA